MEWHEIRIDELGNIVTGSTPPTKQLEYYGSKYPFITPTDLEWDRRNIEITRHLSDAGAIYLKKREVPPLSICFACIGETIGKICMTNTTSFTNQQINSVVVDTEKHDPFFVYYLLRQQGERIRSMAGGVYTKIINKSTFSSVRVHVPSLITQKKIGSILSSYDDVIENNRRRMQLLDEMARTLYREWFVHFRFPGYENVEMVDSELGEIPKSWEVKKIDDAFKILGGGTPSTKREEYWENGDINWYTPSDLTKTGNMFIEESSRRITEVGLKKSSAKVFPAQCVMMTSRATLGVVSVNTTPASTNQGFITCIPNDRVSMYQIFFWIKDNADRLISLGTGTTYKEIIKSVFREMKFVVPPKEFKDEFERVVSPMGQLILNLQRINSALLEARDSLHPGLISGRIDVSGL